MYILAKNTSGVLWYVRHINEYNGIVFSTSSIDNAMTFTSLDVVIDLLNSNEDLAGFELYEVDYITQHGRDVIKLGDKVEL